MRPCKVWRPDTTDASSYHLVDISPDNGLLPLDSVINGDVIPPDMTELPNLSEPNLLECIGARYGKDLIYTSIAVVLVAVNPYKTIAGAYGQTAARRYREASNVSRTDPHVYKIAEMALRGIRRTDKNQTVICSGESGSGKTESTKAIMAYLEHDASSTDMINPVTESFGNARTLRNNNSSRFAKFIKLFHNDDNRYTGSHIETYLLERPRIVNVPQGERNYHVFYQMCADPTMRAKYSLGHASTFNYLGKCVTIDGVDDASNWKVLVNTLTSSGFSERDMDNIATSLAIVLHLGQIDCKSPTSGKKSEEMVAKLAGVSAQLVHTLIWTRNMHVSNEIIKKDLEPFDAADNRDAIAKSIYSSLFDWLVGRINARTVTNTDRWIGILDIFGFESFETNSYEQFCINFANEMMQKYFNDCVLQTEQDEYRREAIPWVDVPIQDNSDTLVLIGGKPSGIFALIDSACILGTQSSADGLRDSIMTTHKACKSIKPIKPSKKAICGFAITHYAASVTYDCSLFLKKNADSLHPDTLAQVCQWNSLCDVMVAPPVVQGPYRFKSIGRTFTTQLHALYETLKSTTTYFVKCINPNGVQKPGLFEWKYIVPQVRCNGLNETVRMLKLGYPFRVAYSTITTHVAPKLGLGDGSTLNTRHLCEALIHCLTESSEGYQLGLTKVFFKGGKHDVLHHIEAHVKRGLDETQRKHIVKWLMRRRWDTLRSVVRFRSVAQRYIRSYRAIRTFRCLVTTAVAAVKFIGKLRPPVVAPVVVLAVASVSAQPPIQVQDTYIDGLEKEAAKLICERDEAKREAMRLAQEREAAIEEGVLQAASIRDLALRELRLTETLSRREQEVDKKQQEINEAHERLVNLETHVTARERTLYIADEKNQREMYEHDIVTLRQSLEICTRELATSRTLITQLRARETAVMIELNRTRDALNADVNKYRTLYESLTRRSSSRPTALNT